MTYQSKSTFYSPKCCDKLLENKEGVLYSNRWKITRGSFHRLTILELRKFFCSQFCTIKASHCSKYENLKSCWCCLNNRIKVKDYLLQVTPTFYTNLALTPTNGSFSISSLLIYSKLLR